MNETTETPNFEKPGKAASCGQRELNCYAKRETCLCQNAGQRAGHAPANKKLETGGVPCRSTLTLYKELR